MCVLLEVFELSCMGRGCVSVCRKNQAAREASELWSALFYTSLVLCRHRRESAGAGAAPPRDGPAPGRWAPSSARLGDRDRERDREPEAAPRGGSRW